MTPLALQAYRLATAAAAPLAGAMLSLRLNNGKEDPDRVEERRGVASLARPDGPLVWLHGASVGETVSMLPLVERLTQRGLFALVTSGTVTSARLMAGRLPPRALHQYAPLDSPRFVRRFLNHWRPGLGLFAESEIWPNMIVEAAEAHVPLALVNARMSERSFRRWRGAGGAAPALLQRFDEALAQSAADAERLAALGARARVIGNMKYDAPPPPADPHELAELLGLVAGRKLWIAASTHPGEERIAAETHLRLTAEFPNLLTLIAPRHPERGAAVAAEIEALGLVTRRRAAGDFPGRQVQVYVCDTMGELGLFYRLAGVAFLGKSLTGGGGGQNPIEPAKLGAALLHGTRVENFSDVYAPLDAEGGALAVNDADELASALAGLLRDAKQARALARAAQSVVERRTGAVERALTALAPQLRALFP